MVLIRSRCAANPSENHTPQNHSRRVVVCCRARTPYYTLLCSNYHGQNVMYLCFNRDEVTSESDPGSFTVSNGKLAVIMIRQKWVKD